jgi:two-component system sensor histidine kinase and response regulator WspE
VLLTRDVVDLLLRGVDHLAAAALGSDDGDSPTDAAFEASLDALRAITAPASATGGARVDAPDHAGMRPRRATDVPRDDFVSQRAQDNSERMLSLAGEALVASRVLLGLTATDALARRADRGVDRALDEMQAALADRPGSSDAETALAAVRHALVETTGHHRDRAAALDAIGQRLSDVVAHLYEGVLHARMRPFGSGIAGMPRMLHDAARELQRDVRLVVTGETTPVDREVLRRLESPLGHLIRNAVDHGIEPPAERLSRGKQPRGTVRVDARHAGGRLLVTVEDDGRGLDVEAIRLRIVQRGLASSSAAHDMSATELTPFLFLPGFTLRDEVTSISGRGVGLDAVHTAVREIGGDTRVVLTATGGAQFELQLPLTLSVVRALVVAVAGESYAFPLARVHRVLRVARADIATVEGRQQFSLDERPVGLVWTHDLLGVAAPGLGASAAIVVIGDGESALGVVVDAFVGEYELVLRGMDARLGKVQDVGGAALLPDGAPTLVLDVDDLLRTAMNGRAGGGRNPMLLASSTDAVTRKRVLVVDDSLTVRELERKMIEGQGYAVDVAVDGMDAWNAIRKGRYDLIVTDVDMPRMDGIELVTRIKGDPLLRTIPVMIVSYKDRDEDRRRGLEAGADYYLTKGSFYDETMLRAIDDFLGGPS